MFKTLFLSIFLFVSVNSVAQSASKLCKGIAKGNFKKVERVVKKVVKKNRKGQIQSNGFGNTYTTLSPSLDSAVAWLNNQDCIVESNWDKCQKKIDIFPGNSSIGIKVKVNNEISEKCFLVQEGRTSNFGLFGWPRIIKSRTVLVYKKMYDCENFIESQKRNCEENN